MSIEKNKNVANGSVKRHRKNTNFTILSNDCVFDKPPLSLEAKGLLWQMFSLHIKLQVLDEIKEKLNGKNGVNNKNGNK